MRKRRYSEEQIIRILRQVEAGEAVKDVCPGAWLQRGHLLSVGGEVRGAGYQ